MLCYQCVVMCGRVIGVTGKLKGGCFYDVALINRERYSLIMKGKRALEWL